MNNGQLFFNEVEAYFNLRQPKISKPTNIYLVVRINNIQRKYATGVKVHPVQWDTIKQEAILSHRLTELDYRNNTIVNNRLKELQSRFINIKEITQIGKIFEILQECTENKIRLACKRLRYSFMREDKEDRILEIMIALEILLTDEEKNEVTRI